MKSAKCLQCGFVGWADAEFCKRCGAELSPDVTAVPVQPVQNYGDDYQMNMSGFQPPLKQGLATTALVIGVLNIVFLGIFVLPIIVGIVISVVALKKIKRYPAEYGGRSQAVAGLVINVVSVVVLIPILIIAAIAVPNLLASRRAANEASAINSLRKIETAQATYQSTIGAGKFGTLADLANENLVAPELAMGTRHGYRFTVVTTADIDGLPGFAAVAVPTKYGSTGTRSFYVDESGVFRGGDFHGAEPTKYDAPLNKANEYFSEWKKQQSRRSKQLEY